MKKIKLHLVVLLILLITGMSFKSHAQFYYTTVNSSNIAGTYTDLGANGTAITVADFDEDLSAPQNIGFNFSYSNTVFTQFILGTNGFIKLGAVNPSGTLASTGGPQDITGSALQSANPLDINIIAPFNVDLDGSVGAGTEYRVFTTGLPGAQTCTIQWKNVQEFNTGGGFLQQYLNFSFQVVLYEGSNRIEFIYGATTPGATSQFHAAAVGVKGTSNASTQLVLAIKGSTAAWTVATFGTAFTGGTQCLNFRITPLAPVGRTFRFNSAAPNDLSITNIYTLGSIASGYSDPHVLSARVQNIGLNAMPATTITLDVSGSNLFNNVQAVPALAAGASTVINFPGYSSPVQGSNTILVTIPADNISSNNTSTMPQAVTANLTSYKYNSSPFTGGVGFTAGTTGVFIAKFQSGNKYGNSDTLNEVKVDFQAAASSRIIRLAIYADSVGLPGTPSRTALYMSAPITVTSVAQQSTITIPNVIVPSVYYAGLLQPTSSLVNMGFSYQSEAPIRTTSFFFSTAVPVTAWSNFAPNNAFRIAVEVRYKIPLPPNCVINQSPADLDPAFCYKSLFSWAANGGAPTGYDVYLSTVQADVDNLLIGAKVASNIATLTFDPTSFITLGNTQYFWKVVAKNTDGDAAGCSTLSFTSAAAPSLPFTENFTSLTFPPSCWDATSLTAIARAPESAYGVGSGSTIFDFYNNGPGNFDFTTPSFGNTPLGHVLSFDYAYATFQTEIDQLELFYSTDDGATYTSLILLNGGLAGILNTGGATANLFVPTASQWAKYQITLPTGTNKVKFTGISVFGNALYIDNVSVDVAPPVPGCAINMLPADAATNQFRDLTLSWTFGPGAAPSGYDVYLDQNISPTTLVSTNQPASSYTTSGLLANTQYYWKIVPKNISGSAIGCTPQTFTTGALYNYCAPTHATVCGASTITNVKMHYTLNNTTTCSAPGYSTFPASGSTTTSLARGQINPISVTTSNSQIVSVWIDYDQNGTFDASEWTQVTTASVAAVATVKNINIPGAALLGLTKMRLRSRGVGNANGPADACTAFGGGESEDYIITIIDPVAPPSCVVSPVLNSSCISQTTLTWTEASGFPSGYKITVNQVTPTPVVVEAPDLGYRNSYTFPLLVGGGTYNYTLTPYNTIGDAIGCTTVPFTAGAAQDVYPAAATALTPLVPYNVGFDGVTAPTLPCGITEEDENGPGNSGWYTSTITPRTGANCLRIDKRTGATAGTDLDDWFFSVPIHVVLDKVYKLSWYDRIASGTTPELYDVYIDNAADASMANGAPLNMATSSTAYALKTFTGDYVATATGVIYFGFHAKSLGSIPSQTSIYIDDISFVEIPAARVNVASCKTYNSQNDLIKLDPIPGAVNYRIKLEYKSGTVFQSAYTTYTYRNNAKTDFRLKWAQGIVYNSVYKMSVAYSTDNINYSTYGPTCDVGLGDWPLMKLRNNPATPGFCDYTISDLNDRFYTDTLYGASNYYYNIVEDNALNSYVYDQNWSRGSSNTDYRLVWAYQAAPSLIERVRFGYKYDVQTFGLVGKTDINNGSRLGVLSPINVPTAQKCKLDLIAASPTTSLTVCTPGGINLSALTDQIFVTPISGANNYQYELTEPVSGNVYIAYRGNGNTDFRLTMIPSTLFPGTNRYGVSYNVRVAAYVGGVWLGFGPICKVNAPSATTTSLLTVCGTTLAVGQFNLPIAITAVPGASNYAFEITGPFTNGGTVRTVYRNNGIANFYLNSTIQAVNLPNMIPNTLYSVKVAFYAGAWSLFGAPCAFTTAASIPRYSPFASEGVEEAASMLNLSVYPNPATVSEQYALELQGITSANEKVQVSIYNLLGDKVYRTEVISKEETILTIKPEVRLAAGVYMAEAQLNGNVYRVKFVVK